MISEEEFKNYINSLIDEKTKDKISGEAKRAKNLGYPFLIVGISLTLIGFVLIFLSRLGLWPFSINFWAKLYSTYLCMSISFSFSYNLSFNFWISLCKSFIISFFLSICRNNC